ncbi:hypothetical protein [Nocardia sp. NPDC058497]|uniref:hypothetical protein n=1 Tax=Nocardia sp. NPDC058497 TaxID=3346529 RepID=UPI00365E65EE
MKRVLVSASVLTAIMAAATGMAAAHAGPATYDQQTNVRLIAEPSAGSSEILDGVLRDIIEIGAGSSSKCEGMPPGHCAP